VIGEALISRLRDAFLVGLGSPIEHLSDHQKAQARELQEKAKLATLTRAIEMIGGALIGMRQSFDPSIDLEVALIRLTHPTLSTELSALVERIETLELGNEAFPEPVSKEVSLSPPTVLSSNKESTVKSSIESEIPAEATSTGSERIEEAWDASKQNLKGLSKALFKELSVTLIEGDVIFLAAPNETHRQKCKERLHEVTSALKDRTGQNWTIEIVVKDISASEMKSEDHQISVDNETSSLNVESLEDAPADAGDELSVISKSFPGAQIIDEET
jgi:DNA polymerase III gamma/tau subunit